MQTIPPNDPDGRIVLLGSLNVGKSLLFNRICGGKAKSANYPGTTVEVSRGIFREGGRRLELVDTPGIAGLSPESEDEIVSRDILLYESIDAIALVMDGKNVRKGLLLFSQLAEYGLPLVANVNMMDEMRQRGIRIDWEDLSKVLGVEITRTIATEGEGIGEFRKSLVAPKTPSPVVEFQPRIEEGLEKIEEILGDRGGGSRGLAVLLLCGDHGARRFVKKDMGEGSLAELDKAASAVQEAFATPLSTVVATRRARWVDEVSARTVEVVPPPALPFADKFGRLCRRPLTGIPIALILIVLVYLFVGKLGAELLVDLLEGRLFGGLIIPGIEKLLAPLDSPLVSNLFVGKFGLVSLGLALDLGLVLPVLFTFFIAFGILEESGYVSSTSVLLNRVMKKFGLTGKGILPLVLGFSCITMAVLSTRTLEKRRERIIATLLLVLGIPCAPLFGAMLAVIAPLSFWAPIVVFGIVMAQVILVGLVAHRFLPGTRSDFIMEIPPIRVPRLWNIIHRAYYRTRSFVIEAVPLFLAGSFILFLLDEAGLLEIVHLGAKPVVSGLLGLPAQGTEAFIMTLVRREAGAAYLKELVDAGIFSGRHIVVALLVMITFSPCVNAALVIWKELGVKVALAIHLFIVPWAIFVGSVTNFALVALGATF